MRLKSSRRGTVGSGGKSSAVTEMNANTANIAFLAAILPELQTNGTREWEALLAEDFSPVFLLATRTK